MHLCYWISQLSLIVRKYWSNHRMKRKGHNVFCCGPFPFLISYSSDLELGFPELWDYWWGYPPGLAQFWRCRSVHGRLDHCLGLWWGSRSPGQSKIPHLTARIGTCEKERCGPTGSFKEIALVIKLKPFPWAQSQGFNLQHMGCWELQGQGTAVFLK